MCCSWMSASCPRPHKCGTVVLTLSADLSAKQYIFIYDAFFFQAQEVTSVASYPPLFSKIVCAAMAEPTPPPTSAQCCCCLCGLWYAEDGGRQHGYKFTCHACGNADRQLRRNLGSRSEVEQLPHEDQVQFYRRLHEEKKQGGKKLPWKTVKAQLIAMVTTRHITTASTGVETEELPLSVWVTRGWEKEVIETCPREWSDSLKTYLYKVPIKKSLWRETHERINERILRQEREATKSKNKKGQRGCIRWRA